MLFHKHAVNHLYDVLSRYYDYLLKYLMRFDHYLEMLALNAQIV